MEQTLVIIKPDGVQRKLVGEIIQRFERKQLKLVQLKVAKMSRALAEEHYAHLKDRDFFADLTTYMSASEVVYLILEGPQAIQVVRNLIGATDSVTAAPGTIRGDYGTAGFQNVVHASDSVAAAQIEIDRFFHRN